MKSQNGYKSSSSGHADSTPQAQADHVGENIPERVIFMNEICNASSLSPMDLCAVESAARNNPNSTILVTTLRVAAGSQLNVTESMKAVMAENSNIRIHVVHSLHSLAKGTPIEHWLKEHDITSATFNATVRARASAVGNLLKYLELYNFGGSILDLDTVTIKPLEDKFLNTAPFEPPALVNTGILFFSKRHKIMEHMLHAFPSWLVLEQMI